MDKKRILITGASGFVGQHLIDLFKDRFTIDVLVRPNSNLKQSKSINEVFHWYSHEENEVCYDAIIHLAGLAHDTKKTQDEERYFHINLGLTEWICNQAIKSNSKKLIFLSSIKAAGDQSIDTPLNEHMLADPQTPYGKSKQQAEDYIVSKTKELNEWIVLRPSMIYGKNFKGNLISLVKLIDRRIPFPFSKYKNKRNLLYIGNLAASIEKIINQKCNSGIYHVCNDEAISTNNLYQWIAEARATKPRLWSLPNWLLKVMLRFFELLPFLSISEKLNKLLGNMEVDNSKLKNELNWKSMPFESKPSIINTFNK